MSAGKAVRLVAVFVLLGGCVFNPVRSSWRGWDGPLDWWQDTIIYQVYPSSFQDSNGDGLGDLNGITSRLDHFVDTGIKTIWVSPIFKSPKADMGYDISNFTAIDPTFGTMADFINLMRAVKAKGLRILMDFVPNHTSDEHVWFQNSIKRIDPYTDYYIWRNATVRADGTRGEPNNWLSLFGGTAWTWVEERGQYYYHLFSQKQPELDHRNADVKQEVLDILKFWLDLGVDGFRMDAVKYIFEDASFADATFIDPSGSMTDWRNQDHNLTEDQPETYDLVYQWRKFVDDYRDNSPDKHTRVILTEAYLRPSKVDLLMQYYKNETHPGAHLPFNFFILFYLSPDSNATMYENIIRLFTDNLPDGCWPNWVVGNHDNHRVATRLGPEMVDAYNMMTLLLPGTPVTYQGEELGQPDTMIRPDQIIDPNNNGNGALDVRDPERGPYLWNSSANAGFSSRKRTWQPVNPSYWRLNLAVQKASPASHYKVYQEIAKLRQHPTLQRGTLEIHAVSTWVFAIVRKFSGNDTVVVVMNVGSEREVIVLGDEISNLPESLSVLIPSLNSGYKVGDMINSTAAISGNSNILVLRPKAAVVLRGAPDSSQIPPIPGDQGNSTAPHNNTATISTISRSFLLLATLPILMRR